MDKIRLAAILLLLAVVSGCGASAGGSGGNTNPGTPPPTDSVSGTVMLKGAPLPGATVSAFLTNTNAVVQTATTDANGDYTITGLQTSGNVQPDYNFWISKPGYGFYPYVGAGGKIMRADRTGDFTQTEVPNIGLYLTVIDYPTVANGSLSGANFTAYDGSNPPVHVAATGQTAAYATGDDGSLHAGVAWPSTRFTDNQNGTVTDSVTGLIWLKNAGCFTATNWANALTDANQLANGACGLTDGSTAGRWRLPNLGELESLVDVSASAPSLTAGNPFTGVSSGIYWSSTSYFGGQAGSPSAWSIRFTDGRYINDETANDKTTASNGVWPVQGAGSGTAKLQSTGMYVVFAAGDDGTVQAGVPLTYPRWIDNGNGTVTDTVTGLIWLKQADCIQQPWAAALAAVNSLASGQCGLSDGSTAGSWRMPNRNEMESLSDRMQNNHADFFNDAFMNPNGTLYQAPIFKNFIAFQYYWTSTTDAASPGEAWTVFICDFGVYDTPKSNTGYTLAVR